MGAAGRFTKEASAKLEQASIGLRIRVEVSAEAHLMPCREYSWIWSRDAHRVQNRQAMRRGVEL